MSKRILLSVILPLLNASEDVEGVFKAIAAQTDIDKDTVEVVIVNDGSTDDTDNKIKQYEALLQDFGTVVTITHPQRTGQVEARLDAAKKARGKFLVFIDKRTRPDSDYFVSLLAKKRDIVIGNVYMDKQLSPWDRLLALVRKKLYFPYFNHPFEDFELDREAYRRFKIKGGGGALLVLRAYYLRVVESFKKGKHVSDDSMLIEKLVEIEPLVKTSKAKILYLNRTGFKENIRHIYDRGPKFVDYYIHPGTRFFPPIVALMILLGANIVIAVSAPIILPYELVAAVFLLVVLSIYLSEEPLDFMTCLLLFPVIFVAFVAGIIKGLVMKLLRLY